MQRRMIIGALLLIGVGVVLGTTVFRADIAQATGLAPSVTVNNTTSNPVPVNVTNTTVPVHEQGTAKVDVQNLPPEQTPYQVEISCLYQGHGFCRSSATVPTGQRFVIQTVSGWAYHAVDDFELDIEGSGFRLTNYFSGTPVNDQGLQAETVIDTRSVTLYADPGSNIGFLAVTVSGAEASGGAHVTLTGYLIPAS